MTQYDNNLSGALFKNDRKAHANQPDYRGDCEIERVKYWVSAWIKEGKNGKYMSLSFTAKEEQQAQPPAPSRPKDEAWRAGSQRADANDPPF